MAKKQPPFKVISKPPDNYKVPDMVLDVFIKKAIELVLIDQAG